MGPTELQVRLSIQPSTTITAPPETLLFVSQVIETLANPKETIGSSVVISPSDEMTGDTLLTTTVSSQLLDVDDPNLPEVKFASSSEDGQESCVVREPTMGEEEPDVASARSMDDTERRSDPDPAMNKGKPPIDSAEQGPNDGSMSTPSRDELELRFQLLDERLENSFSRSNERIASLLDSQQRLQERLERQVESIASLNATARIEFAKDLKFAEKEIAEKNANARIEFAKELKDAERNIADRLQASNSNTVDQIKAENKSLKSTIIVTAIGTVLTIVIGVGAFNATVLSNMVASFDSGKSVAEDLSKSSNDLKDATKRQEEIGNALREAAETRDRQPQPSTPKAAQPAKR